MVSSASSGSEFSGSASMVDSRQAFAHLVRGVDGRARLGTSSVWVSWIGTMNLNSREGYGAGRVGTSPVNIH